MMQRKNDVVKKYYSGEIIEENEYEFNYEQNFDALAEFKGTHPSVMKERIAKKNWKIKVDTSKIRMKLKYRILYWIEKSLENGFLNTGIILSIHALLIEFFRS